MLGRPATLAAEDAEAVRVVEDEASAVLAAGLDDAGQGRDLALHRVDAVDRHELAGVAAALEHALEVLHVVVTEALHLGIRELRAVEDGRVGAPIHDHDVATLREPGDDPEVRHVTRREEEARVAPEEPREPLLEVRVQLERAVEAARSHRPAPQVSIASAAAFFTRGSVASPR